MITFSFGRVRFNIFLPAGCCAEVLPHYIQGFSGECLPRAECEIFFEHRDTAPASAEPLPRMLGLPLGAFSAEGDRVRIWSALPVGPDRPDIVPTQHVIPILHWRLFCGGVLPLHASMVEFQGRALIFAGRSGSGKSTLARGLTERGATFLADERVLLCREESRVMAMPSFERPNPFQRWSRRDPLVDPPRPRAPESAYGRAFPVSGIFFPGVRAEASSAIQAASGAEAYAALAVTGAGEFPGLEKLVTSVSAHRLTLGAGMDRLIDEIIKR